MNSLENYFSESTITTTKIAPYVSESIRSAWRFDWQFRSAHISACSLNDSTGLESTTPFHSTQESTHKSSGNLISKFFKKFSANKIVSKKSTSDSEPEEAEFSEAACLDEANQAINFGIFQNENGHQFPENWYSKYTWLECSKHRNSAFCFACR